MLPFVVSAAGSVGMQFSSGFAAVEPVVQFEFWQASLALADTVSPPIYTNGAPATRAPTKASALVAPLDTSSFKAGGSVFELALATGTGTLWKSGDSSLIYDKAANQIQAKTLANTAVIAVPDLSVITSAFFAYDGVNIYPIVDGVSGTGVASTEPVLGASFALMQDGAGGGYFDSPNIASFQGGPI